MAVNSDNKIHMIGIGGSGMSGIAGMLRDMGRVVSGSDLNSSKVTDSLRESGVEVFLGHSSENVAPDTDLVVFSTAIPDSNPEIRRAVELGIPVIRRGEMLARLFNSRQGIAVAGAHGKTTTTSMIAMMLEDCGLDPSYIIGGQLQGTHQGARLGKGDFFVAEADESDGSFLHLDPHIAVVTNIEDDHLDYYRSRERLNGAFRQFVSQVKTGGFALLFGDDPILGRWKEEFRHLLFYGSSKEFDYYFDDWQTRGWGSTFKVFHDVEFLGTVELSIPGLHNVFNALAAVATGSELGISFDAMADSLRRFKGAKRRLELLGRVNEITIIDDYAHHPTEIAATISAIRQFHQGRLLAVFQPHRYSRTKLLAEHFGGAFQGVDLLFVTSIYSAGEEPIPGVNAEIICDNARHRGCEASFIPDSEDMIELMKNEARAGDVIIFIGAGDIWKTGVNLKTALEGGHPSA